VFWKLRETDVSDLSEKAGAIRAQKGSDKSDKSVSLIQVPLCRGI
jgi:hypothetical protein